MSAENTSTIIVLMPMDVSTDDDGLCHVTCLVCLRLLCSGALDSSLGPGEEWCDGDCGMPYCAVCDDLNRPGIGCHRCARVVTS